ncbi:hypothetical protein KM043_014990 [Ampulex compressa]|nr:hypothetical protein KM043_014990 [Ampulex compressa]
MLLMDGARGRLYAPRPEESGGLEEWVEWRYHRGGARSGGLLDVVECSKGGLPSPGNWECGVLEIAKVADTEDVESSGSRMLGFGDRGEMRCRRDRELGSRVPEMAFVILELGRSLKNDVRRAPIPCSEDKWRRKGAAGRSETSRGFLRTLHETSMPGEITEGKLILSSIPRTILKTVFREKKRKGRTYSSSRRTPGRSCRSLQAQRCFESDRGSGLALTWRKREARLVQ